MTKPATTSTVPEAADPPTQRRLLSDAVERAGLAARVEMSEDGTALDLTLLSSGKLLFDHDTKQARAWLRDLGIGATARYNDTRDIVLSVPVPEVERLIAVLFSPAVLVGVLAANLDDLLARHPFLYSVNVLGSGTVELTLHNSAEYRSGALFAALCGASGIADGVDLTRGKGIEALTARLSWLVTGITGSRFVFDGLPPCRHAPDTLRCRLTRDQIRLLTDRINAGQPKEHAPDPRPPRLAPPKTRPDDCPEGALMPAQPAPAAPDTQHQLLADAFDLARIGARIEVAEDGTTLEVNLSSLDKLPFDRDVAQATAWLTRTGVEATARLNDNGDVLLALPAHASAGLVSALLAPHIRIWQTSTRLNDVLTAHDLAGGTAVRDTGVIVLRLYDSEEDETGQRFAALCGAPGIATGLDLGRDESSIHHLAERLSCLVSGITGSYVVAEGTPGCRHEPDELALTFSVDGARLLAERLESQLPPAAAGDTS
ncbi:hypothetical protein [Streptomyces sp. NPDC059894]|uniref:hypothetical protein n=1 Tax=unclassified Streptomyces TaxID=2593676 RepID=UPI003668F41B